MTAAGASFNPDGEGYLQKREGKWVFGEPDFLTKPVADVLYAPRDHAHPYRPHAPFHHWDGGDALAGQQIAELRTVDRPTWAAVRLDPSASAPPTRRIGDMFWDADNHCPSFVLEGSDTIWQGPMEDLLYGQNDSGVAHANGLVGYIKGSQGQRPTIDISRADNRTKSLAVVFATEASIIANNSGYYTSRGLVRDVNTNAMPQGSRLWLQPAGGYGTSKPIAGSNTRNVSLGHVIRSHSTTGSLFADITPYPFLDEISGVSIDALSSSEFLQYNGSVWTNSKILASDLPNHAFKHHWDGSDPLSGQSISGLRSIDTPSFSGISIGESGGISGTAGTNDFWRVKGISLGINSGYLEIATADDGTEPIIFRQYTGVFTSVTRELTLLGSTGETTFPVKIHSPNVRVTSLSAGFVRSDSSGNLSSSSLLASELPSHASRHHWNGDDPLSGQSISGLKITDSPSFSGITIGVGGIDLGSLVGIGKNGLGGIYMRPSSGIVRFTVEDANVNCGTAFSANSGQFTNLSTGFVRSNSVGQLSSSSLLASELPNHASRHHWDGADPLIGQLINGLRTTDSPRFYNVIIGGELRLKSYYIYNYDDKLSFETSLYDRMAYMDHTGFYEEHGVFPLENGIECGRDGLRWNFRSNDINHDVEIINATEGAAGSSVASIPSVGNSFRLSAPTAGMYKNFRIPDNAIGIGKELILTCTSMDPNGFIRVYAPSSGYLMSNGASVAYIDFPWGRKLVLHSDGNRWYV